VGDGNEGAVGNYFRLNFALLAGDFNGDGVVTTAQIPGVEDIVTANDPWSDGNGDGSSDVSTTGADYGVRNAAGNANDFLPLRQVHGADFLDDEVIDGGDLNVWRAKFSFGVEADFDGDGDSDGADFLYWQRLLGSKSAWANNLSEFADTLASVFGASSSVAGDFAPRVMNVIVSGSLSLHDPFYFDTVVGSGEQIRTVPVGGADTVSIVFSEDVNVTADSLMVIGLLTADVPALAEFSYDALTYTATWRFDEFSFYGDQYLLALSDGVTDVDDGNWLDGDWVNPAAITTVNTAVSEFPSGNGTPGGWFKFVMTLLPGDANQDLLVNNDDWDIFTEHMYLPDASFGVGDFDGDGEVTSEDETLYFLNWGRVVQSLSILADFDGDLEVDSADLDRIADNAGMTGATWADGDLDGDGEVTVDDLDLALAQYGWGISAVA
jgi:hypothetical protein